MCLICASSCAQYRWKSLYFYHSIVSNRFYAHDRKQSHIAPNSFVSRLNVMVYHKRMEKWWLVVYMHDMMKIKLIKFDVHTCQNDCATSGWLAGWHIHTSSLLLQFVHIDVAFFNCHFFPFFLLPVLHMEAATAVAAKQTVLDARKWFKTKNIIMQNACKYAVQHFCFSTRPANILRILTKKRCIKKWTRFIKMFKGERKGKSARNDEINARYKLTIILVALKFY